MASNSTTDALVGSDGRYPISPLTASIAFAAVALLCWRMMFSGLDPMEPPEAAAKIPLVGHLIGMLRYQIEYFEMLSKKYNLPIYTMRIFSSRVYVIASPELIHNGFRDTKALSFDPFIIEASRRLFSTSEHVMKIIEASPEVEGGETYMSLVHEAMYKALAPGPALLQTNARVLTSLSNFINKIGTDEQPIKLYLWIRDIITIATADAMYGPKNPISDDPKVIEDMWAFEHDYLWIMMYFMPQIIARKAYFAREAVNTAFRKYYADGLLHNASPLVKDRWEAAIKYGISETEIADFELGVIVTATTNSAPSSFWFLSYIMSSPSLVTDLRAEISKTVIRKTIDGIDTLEMDITGFQKNCPLLVSTWEETLRLVDSSSSVRAVVKDTIFASKYLLKKGSVVQMPSGVTHNSTQIWGADAGTFNPRRFLKASPDTKLDAAARDRRKLQTQGYFPFGGGKHLCPGRHFAFTEIVSFVATIVYGFEVEMADGSGPLKVPKPALQKMGTGTKKPSHEMNVKIRRRSEFEGVRWTYRIGGEVDFASLSTGEHRHFDP